MKIRVLLALVSMLAVAGFVYRTVSTYRHFRRGVEQQTRGIADEAARRAAVVERRLPDFFVDRARVMAEPLFAVPSMGQRDAAPLMEALVRWRPASRSSAAYEHAMARFKEYRSDYHEPPAFGRWLQDELPPTLRLDAAWLDDYQVWNIDVDSPRALFESDDPFEVGFSLPEPDFGALVSWGRLLLSQGARDGNPRAALARVKRLARLMLTTEDVVAEHDAIILLSDAERFARQHRLAPPIDPQALRAAARYYEGLRGVLVPQLGDDQLHRIFDTGAPGVCAELADSMPFLQSIRAGLERRSAPFYQWLDALAASDACRLPLVHVRRAWRPFGERALLERWDQIQSPPDEGWEEKLYFAVGVRVPALQANFGEAMVLHALEHFEAAYP